VGISETCNAAMALLVHKNEHQLLNDYTAWNLLVGWLVGYEQLVVRLRCDWNYLSTTLNSWLWCS
jgi:hypothetical protein